MYPHALVDAGQLADAPVMPTAAELAAYRAAPPPRNAAPEGLFAAPAARLAGALVQFRDYANAYNPKRDRASDGWIGDAAHAARDSQHNPDVYGVVTASDTDVDGVPLADWFERLRIAVAAGRLPAFVGGHLILNRRITTPDFKGWYAYKGANAHVLHGHAASSRDRARYDLRADLAAILGGPPKPAPPTGTADSFRASYGQTSAGVGRLQTFLRQTFPAYARGLPSTRFYGDLTAAVVAEFSHRAASAPGTPPGDRPGLRASDGRDVGPRTAAALARFGFRG